MLSGLERIGSKHPSTMHPILSIPGAAVVVASLVFVLLRRISNRPRYPLPPGPPGKPFVGNLLDLPEKEGWILPVVYRDLGRSLGTDLVYLNLCGGHVIVVNTVEAANDLFQRRAHIYSDRPQLNAMHKIMRFDWFTAIMQPDDYWKTTRKALVANFKAREYRDVETRSAHTLLRELLVSPGDFLAHIRRYDLLISFILIPPAAWYMANSLVFRMNTATTMAITYGIDMTNGANEHLVDIGEGIIRTAFYGTTIPAIAFDAIPALVNAPSWFLGGQYKRESAPHAKSVRDMLEVPFKEFQRTLTEGQAKPSIVYSMISNSQSEEDKELAKVIGANVYFSGVNNVNSPLSGFVMAMAKYPSTQRRAQQEVDAVVGDGRLPTFADQPFLPFVDAIVKELLRWHPVAPIVTPHAAAQDDIYKGYFIPKGALVIGNAWAMLHDESQYPEPEAFKPERWLERPAGDFPFPTFGFGRRLCPGMEYTREMLFITIASLLATYDFSFPVDSSGKPIVPAEDWSSTIFSYPAPFHATITPRSSTAKDLVLATAAERSLTDP